MIGGHFDILLGYGCLDHLFLQRKNRVSVLTAWNVTSVLFSQFYQPLFQAHKLCCINVFVEFVLYVKDNIVYTTTPTINTSHVITVYILVICHILQFAHCVVTC